MFERFSDHARRVVVLAQEEARLLCHNYIGTEHILLGLVHDGDGTAANALQSAGVSLEAVRAHVEEIIGQGASSPSNHIPFTPRAKRVLDLALREALRLGHDHIGTGHILLGVIGEGEGVAAQVLRKLGLDLDALRAMLSPTPEDSSRVAVISGARRPRIIPQGAGTGEESCSFCGRDLWDVERHVISALARICGECVDACRKVIDEAVAQDSPGAGPLRLPARVFGPRPVDDEAVEEVTDAFTVACGGDRNDEERAQHIQDGESLAPLLSVTGARYGQPISAVVYAVRFVSDDHAQVRFGIRFGPSEFPFTGDALRLQGRWLVSRDTIGTLLATAGVSLPARHDN